MGTSQNTKTEPAVQAEATLDVRGGLWTWTVKRCPFCGQRHHHGGGRVGGVPLAGMRVAHCGGEGREYRLVDVTLPG